MTFSLGDGLTVHLDTLVDTRLLVQANSGGGKSWMLRRLLEQTHGHVQHLVIDPEGEFASLREQFDYVHAAKIGGDTAAEPRAAALLAERLLELKASAILDIYELKAHERVRFVKLFLEAVVDAPKALWHPALVIVDEAHVYCPEKGEAESAGAVKDLATRGRKRGFSVVLATQRLSKLHKDAAAECNNKLIGRTGLDIDMDRAGDELGMPKAARQELRTLKPGEFFAFGPAFRQINGVARVIVGPVQTTHPKAGGHRKFEAPPPTAAIKKLLPSLADLPAEAEGRQRSLDDLKREIAELKRHRCPTVAPTAPAKTVERFVLKDGQFVRAEKLIGAQEAIIERFAALFDDYARRIVQPLDGTIREIAGAIKQTLAPAPAGRMAPSPPSPSAPPGPALPRRSSRADDTSRATARPAADGALSGGELKTLIAIAQYDEGVTREQLTQLTGYKRSSRDTFLQRLGARGYADIGRDTIRATDAGLQGLGPAYEPLPTGHALYEWWMTRLPPGGERVILEYLVEKVGLGRGVTRDAITDATGYKRSSRDTFLQRLGAKKLIDITTGGVRAAEILFG